ncbi:MAG: SOS response-associated peptidase, partial [Candidatus Kariarchaeaceae archaeon]
MCGRFSRFTGMDAIIAAYGIDIAHATPLRSYNIAPSQEVAVIRRENPLVLRDMTWGFIPFFAKDLSSTHRPINARDDSLTKPMYKYAIESRRCLIPSNGFYEWKRKGPVKQPYYIRHEEEELLSFGGIYSLWTDPVSDTIYTTFAIITTSPNEMMA